MYCRPLVEAGRVYIALSPLYNIKKGKKNTYFIDKGDFHAYVLSVFCKSHTIANARTGKVFTKQQVSQLILNNEKYKVLLEKVAHNNAIHPILLEDILLLRKESYDKFKKMMNKKYRFLKINRVGDSTVIEGQAYDVIHTIILNQLLYDQCKQLFPYLDNSDKRYVLDGKKVGLYEILFFYHKSEPEVIRNKGLGALNSIQLGESTLDPENRKMLRYTTRDIEEEIEHIRKINDGKFELLRGVDISEYEF